MVARGARHFVFLSRSGADKPEAASLLKDLEEYSTIHELNMTIETVRGDVANRLDVVKAIGAARTPIKGVIQAAMVLRVCFIEQGFMKMRILIQPLGRVIPHHVA